MALAGTVQTKRTETSATDETKNEDICQTDGSNGVLTNVPCCAGSMTPARTRYA
jgi:hypothetical protein